jgi:hypothetical protein
VTKPVVLALVWAVLGQGCGKAPEPLPEVKKPTPAVTQVARIPKPDFTVLEREISGIELVFVVTTPDAPATPREGLLNVADYLAQDTDPGLRTVVLFQKPRQPLPARRLHRSEQLTRSFAVAVIDPFQHVRQVQTGVFN